LPEQVTSVFSELLQLQGNEGNGGDEVAADNTTAAAAAAAATTADEDAAAMRVYTVMMAKYYQEVGIDVVANLRLFPDDDDDGDDDDAQQVEHEEGDDGRDEAVIVVPASIEQVQAAENQIYQALATPHLPSDQEFRLMRALEGRSADELVHEVDEVPQAISRARMPRMLSKQGVQRHIEKRNIAILTAGAAAAAAATTATTTTTTTGDGSGCEDGEAHHHGHGRKRRHDDSDWHTERQEQANARRRVVDHQGQEQNVRGAIMRRIERGRSFAYQY
jgi:hypothetical protein